MNSETIIHPKTKQLLDSILRNPIHAIAIEAPDGSGKGAIAHLLARKLLDIESLNNYPYLVHIEPTGKTISIENVRDLQEFLKLKTIGKPTIRRIAIVEHADRLTLEAQNALLKTLEEPPSDTVLILTIANRQLLLPTVVSRLQTVSITQPTKKQLEEYFTGQQISEKQLNHAYNLSGGLIGLMQAMIDNEGHPLLEATESAKKILQESRFEKLISVDELIKSKADLVSIFQAIIRIADITIAQAAKRGDGSIIERWERILAAASSAQTELAKNAQAKLVLTNFMLDI